MVYVGPGIDLVGTSGEGGVPHLYRSGDGVHWTEITPPAAEKKGEESYPSFAQATFVTSTDGYVSALDQPDSTAFLYTTTDGGTTWSTVPFGGGFHGINSVQMVTPTFAVESGRCFGIPCAPVQTSTDGFRTLDSPLTFGLPNGPEPPPTIDPLPPVTFITPEQGFTASLIGSEATTDGWTPRPLFAATHDGGHTWQQVAPPTASAQSIYYALPTFKSPDDGIVPTLSGPAGSRRLTFDSTIDGGRTWQIQTILPTTIDPTTVDQAVIDLASTTTWWVINPGPGGHPQVQTTADGGAHWTTTTATFPGPADQINPDQFVVADASHALAIASVTPFSGSPSELLHTADAGRTWQPLTMPPPVKK